MEHRILTFGLILFCVDKILSLSDKSSLTFVIDNTGSMQVDVYELNKTADVIFENVNSDTSQIDEFVLVTFNDPDVILHNSSSNREDFKRNLGSIMPSGGGNCAEMSMNGIKKGLQHSLPGSLVWVFTDASAADYELFSEVEDLSQELGIQVFFAITGLCDDRSSPDYLVYRDLTISTNGQLFHLKKNEIGKLLKYVEHLIDNRKDIITSRTLTAGRHQIEVQTDEDIDELIVAMSGECPVVTVTDPDRRLVSTTYITKLREMTVVKLNTFRKIGPYKLTVDCLSATHVVVSSDASLHFQHGFSRFIPLDLSGTTRKPIPDVESYLSIRLASKKDYEVHSVQILDMDDNIILEQPMKLVSKATQIYTTNDKITPPTDMFKVAIKLRRPNSDMYLIKHGLTPIKSQNNTKDPTPPVETTTPLTVTPTKKEKCQQPKDSGQCWAWFQMWYYDSAHNECQRFYYGGCGGNENRFNTQEECRIECVGAIITTTQSTTVPTATPLDVCQQPVIVGRCHSAIRRWYYDNTRKGCRPFIYGGCQGNENNFPTEAACQNRCLEVEEITPITEEPKTEPTLPVETTTLVTTTRTKKGKCQQPKDSGRCRSSFQKWYYDSALNECQRFVYGGCQGNENRFNTQEECRAECVGATIATTQSTPKVPTATSLDVCQQPVIVGRCRGAIRRWYYDNTRQECRPFIYGGCQGNENNFDTEAACQNRCLEVEETTPITEEPKADKCQLPKAEGPCWSSIPKWYYDSVLNVCREFIYGGCLGNENRFPTEEQCLAECKGQPIPLSEPPTTLKIEPTLPVETTTPVTTTRTIKGKCQQPKDSGRCRSSFQKWYYDSALNECQRFVYGGCQGNENRFNTQEECRAECVGATIATTQSTPKVPTATSLDVCQQPVIVGRCRGAIRRWYYDNTRQECRPFIYGGCQGNENNFDTEAACQNRCLEVEETTPITEEPKADKCQLPKAEGPCWSSIPKWYYDSVLNVCREFIYGGCLGNENRFPTEEQCLAECKGQPIPLSEPPTTLKIEPTLPVETTTPVTTTRTIKGKCQQPKDSGRCRSSFQKWYYDSALNECQRFVYGGCQGNENRFNTQEECRAECVGATIATTQSTPKVPTATSLDVCQQPVIAGRCRGAIRRWYYDNTRQECRPFIYGGCQGNENNFDTEAACQNRCLEVEETTPITEEPKADKCQLPKAEGPCWSSIPKWYYDSVLNVCREFVYGGCLGNENRFPTKEQCLAECKGQPIPLSEPPTTHKIEDLNVKYDSNGYDPLILTQNNEFANFETSDGQLRIPANETIKLVCPQKFQNLVRQEVLATYVSDNQFLIQPTGQLYAYSDLKCMEPWQFKNLRTGFQCYNTDFELSNVGFEIKGTFKEVYQVCLNRFTMNPIYTKIKMVQSQPNEILNKDSPWFDRDSTADLDKIYDCSTQNDQISKVLNREFHSDGCCFAKRMLVNPLDVAPGVQSTTYSYLNVAPHWSTCNSQNWVEVEKRIRELRRQSDRPLEVLTGIAQALQLPYTSSDPKNITLTQSGKEFQVPKYFWKIVYDPHTKAALVIIQVNIPDLQLRNSFNFVQCTDVCWRTKWMNSRLWRNPSRGYTYCCSLETFKSAFHISDDGVIPTSSELLVEAVKVDLPDNVV